MSVHALTSAVLVKELSGFPHSVTGSQDNASQRTYLVMALMQTKTAFKTDYVQLALIFHV